MKQTLHAVSQHIIANKVVAIFAIVLAFTVFTVSATASAAPDYFSVDKPSSVGQCDGGTWKTVHKWHRNHWYWKRVRVQVWQPNWEKLGFDSYRQCVRYTSTSQPQTKRECREDWRALGFSDQQDCKRYLRLHPASGYDGRGSNDS